MSTATAEVVGVPAAGDEPQGASQCWPEGALSKSRPVPAHLRPALLEELILERLELERQLVELIDFELQLDDSIAQILDQLGSAGHPVGELVRTCFERAHRRVGEQSLSP